MQEVQRPTGSLEFVAARDCARLGRKPIDGVALLAKLRRGVGQPVDICAVEPAVDLRELVVHIVDPEITPQSVVVVML